jgi:hypothetical protein
MEQPKSMTSFSYFPAYKSADKVIKWSNSLLEEHVVPIDIVSMSETQFKVMKPKEFFICHIKIVTTVDSAAAVATAQPVGLLFCERARK